jgi:hypothetical protein
LATPGLLTMGLLMTAKKCSAIWWLIHHTTVWKRKIIRPFGHYCRPRRPGGSAHTFKYISRIQELNTGSCPRSSESMWKPAMAVASYREGDWEITDMYAFVFHHTGISLK